MSDIGLSGALPEDEANRRVEELRRSDPVVGPIIAAGRYLDPKAAVDPHGS